MRGAIGFPANRRRAISPPPTLRSRICFPLATLLTSFCATLARIPSLPLSALSAFSLAPSLPPPSSQPLLSNISNRSRYHATPQFPRPFPCRRSSGLCLSCQRRRNPRLCAGRKRNQSGDRQSRPLPPADCDSAQLIPPASAILRKPGHCAGLFRFRCYSWESLAIPGTRRIQLRRISRHGGSVYLCPRLPRYNRL